MFAREPWNQTGLWLGAGGALTPCETLPIKAGIDDCRIGASGYLYCFANDAWNFYDNNRGSVRLRVRRLS